MKRQIRTEEARERSSSPRSEGPRNCGDRNAYRRIPRGSDKKADVGAGSGEMKFRVGFGRGRTPQ